MAGKVIGISDMNTAKQTGSVITYALGSCVGVALYDKTNRIAGLAHIMLPDSGEAKGVLNVMKYADTAVPALVGLMVSEGAQRMFLIAKIAGGAQMFSMSGDRFRIGERNIAASKHALQKLKIPLVGEDTGCDYGRTVEIFAENGLYRIKAINKSTKEL